LSRGKGTNSKKERENGLRREKCHTGMKTKIPAWLEGGRLIVCS